MAGVALQQSSYDVLWRQDAHNLLNELTLFNPDLCILDFTAETEEYQVCREIKTVFPLLPLIFLMKDEVNEKIVKGFHAGCTGLLFKPYDQNELLSSISLQLRPKTGYLLLNAGFRDEIRIGKCVFSPDLCKLVTPVKTISISLREMQVLQLLTDHPNCLVERNTLLFEIWGDDSPNISRTLDVYIRRIRKLLEPDHSLGVHTIKGKGYLLMVRNM